MNRLSYASFLAFLLVLMSSACTEKGSIFDEVQLSALPDRGRNMLDHINAIRSEGCRCGADQAPAVPALRWNDQLAEAARRHADDMAVNRLYSHTGSDGSTVGMRAKDAGYSWSLVGENIAHGLTAPREVLQAWLDSPSHCKTLMAAEFTEMGLATQEGYWVQTLGLPGK